MPQVARHERNTVPAQPDGKAPASQTLSRGVRILEILAESRVAMAIDEIASSLEVHRSIAYRLVRTLEDHRLVTRDSAGAVVLGARLAALAAGVAADLQSEALPELTAVANDLGITCFLVVLDQDECITLTSVEPRHTIASVAQKPGRRHSAALGTGKTLLSQLPEREWPIDPTETLRAEVAEIRERGYGTSRNEVIPTVQSVTVPLALPGRTPAALAVIYVDPSHDPAVLAARLDESAAVIRTALGG